MLKLLHLTPKKNLHSIKSYGLLPFKPTLEHHLESFQKDGLIGNKCIYYWDPNFGDSTDKIIKDFIYCNHFIKPRNKFEEWQFKTDDYKEFGQQLYGEAQDWLLLEIDINENEVLETEYVHEQISWNGGSCELMKPQYEHDDKLLRIGHDKLNFTKIKVIKEISTRLYKNNTIGVNYHKI